MRHILLFLIITIYPLASLGEEPFPEPFGLNWDMSEQDLKELGFTLAGEASSDGLNVFSSVSTPKPWSKGETYFALTYKNRLVKVVAFSIDFTNDILGTEGKEMYNKIKTLLSEKYGNPSDHFEFTDRDLYDENDEFYQCLEYSGCGAYISVFEFAGGTIAIQLNGKGRGTGYLDVGYESPDFSTAKRQIEQESKESDTDAF